ncbi:8-amino-7-oxononanoate synthase [Citrobacter sp. JGM124]|uniref:8-amino-7-oxononanoate synthase n=1 Tax=Citrobacter sp. JGM124 TaxID=2799789 RepID=UPI001BAA233C|nr:8-amino-7-oxononanoate synthase [Citrobacter sp. JGM124]MBS0847697.1 8-amino-7-oxononanoate synthase [Citrobacter sp. JGM124]
MSWQQRMDQALGVQQEKGLFRQRQAHQQHQGRKITFDGRQYLNFSSNDYLGLSQHPALIAAWQQGAEQWGVGSCSSGHITGYSQQHQLFEQELADWLGFDRALLFISGYSANQAVISALGQKQDLLVADKLCHASMLEAAMHSPASLKRFHHNDTEALNRLLTPREMGETLLMTEGVFSMDGDSAPLATLAHQARQAGAWFMVDDAHGTGVVGDEGRGSCQAQQVTPDILVVTFGKAWGVSGAAVLCNQNTADYLVQYARHLIYSTMMPIAQAYTLRAALQVIRHADDLRARLQSNIQRFCQGAEALPFQRLPSNSAIQPLIMGENQMTTMLANRLREQGFWLTAIRPPTVPLGSARLRITLSASHNEEDIDRLLETLYDAAS